MAGASCCRASIGVCERDTDCASLTAMPAPRVLAVAPELPWPPRNGGHRRLAALLETLADAYELHVVLVHRSADGSTASRPAAIAATVEVARPRSVVVAGAEMLAGLARGRPLTMAHYRRPRSRRALRAVIRDVRPDVIVASWLGGAALVDGLVDSRQVVLDLDNAEHLRFASMARAAPPPRRWMLGVDALLIRRWMAARLGGFGAVILASMVDAAACHDLAPEAHLVVAENGADLDGAVRPDPGGGSVLLLGNLDYAPNADALQWFDGSILPSCAAVEEVRVVGGGAPVAPTVDARIVLVGHVPDVGDELRRATVLAAPVRAGAGTRLKILEAMAAGVPVVSTTLGASGLAVRDGEHLLLADDERSFATAVDALLREPARRQRLACAARSLVQERHGWQQAMAPIVNAVAEVARGARSASV